MDRDPIIETLCAARLEQGLSLREVGERCGVTPSGVSEWEHDRALPPPPRLRRWADALGYDLVLVKREDE